MDWHVKPCTSLQAKEDAENCFLALLRHAVTCPKIYDSSGDHAIRLGIQTDVASLVGGTRRSSARRPGW